MKITYHKEGDYLYPVLPPENKEKPLGKYGRMRLRYLKGHRRITYTNLLTAGGLWKHLHEIESRVNGRVEFLIQQMAEKQGVTEELKENNQMEWVGKMNNVKACAEEIAFDEILYE